MGDYILGAFRTRLANCDQVKNIRGKGLMIGIELNLEANHLRQRALEKGLLLNVTQGNVIRLLPPLIINAEQGELIVDVVCALVEDIT